MNAPRQTKERRKTERVNEKEQHNCTPQSGVNQAFGNSREHNNIEPSYPSATKRRLL
jgi:hypothetical protein